MRPKFGTATIAAVLLRFSTVSAVDARVSLEPVDLRVPALLRPADKA